MRVRYLFPLLLACLVSPNLGAQPAGVKKVTSVEGINEYVLDNGLKVLIFPDASQPKVTVNLTVLVGSRHEGYGETGMAHLLEHMVFKGTPEHRDIPKALRDHAERFNGTTWLDRTNYWETMPATDENLEFGIRLEADRLVNSFIRREDLISEMTVVRSEFEQGENDPKGILGEKILSAAYEWHNYGKSTIGNRTDIERVPIDNLKAFYKKFYQPDNCVLVLAGKLDEKKALDLVVKYFGKLPRPTRQLDKTYTEEPPQDGDRLVNLRRVGSVAAMGAAYHIVSGTHPDFPACEVLEDILTNAPSGRLYQALVATKKASSVTGSAFGLHDPGVIEMGAQCEPANLDTVRDTFIDVVENLAKKPVTAEEVERSKRVILKQHEDLMNDSSRVAIRLSDWISKGDWRLMFLHRDRVEKVTPDDCMRVANQFLKRNNRTLGMFIPTAKPERVEVASAPPIADMLKDYKGRAAMAEGETFDPSPANIDSRTKIENIDGIKAALLPRKTRGESVTLQLNLRFGNEESLKGLTTAAGMLGTMMPYGTKDHTRQQLKDELEKLGARLQVTSGSGNVSVSLTAKRSTLPQAIALMTEVLRSPSFPQNEFDTLTAAMISGLEEAKTDPQRLTMRTLQKKLSHYPESDVRYVTTIEEDLARVNAVKLDQIKQIYAEQLNGHNGELAVVGDFDADALVAQLRKSFANWDSKVPYRRISREASTKIAGEKIKIVTPDKANAIFAAGLVFPQDDKHADFAALEMGNYLLGGGTLSSRLGTRVRQKEGLSYGIQSAHSASSLDPYSRFVIMAISNPANVGKVDTCVQEEMNKFLTEGLTATELAEGKKAFLDQLKSQRTTDRQLAATFVENLAANRNFAYYADLEKKIADLTPEQILEAFKKRVAMDKLIVIHAGDFK